MSSAEFAEWELADAWGELVDEWDILSAIAAAMGAKDTGAAKERQRIYDAQDTAFGVETPEPRKVDDSWRT